MLVTALLLLSLGALSLAAYLARRKPAAEEARQPEYLPPPRSATRVAQAPRTLEVAHASRSGALALTAGPAPRLRPGHRCVEEVRRRCHVDFSGALNFLEGQLNRRVSDNPLEQA